MPYFPFSPYEPDNALLNEDASRRTINALPGTGGFDPIPALIAPFPKLPEPCCSIWGGSEYNESFLFAGSAGHLYRWLSGQWKDVTRQDGDGNPAPYHISDEIGWSFISFQQTPMCCGYGDAPQIWDSSLGRFRDVKNTWQLPNPTSADTAANPSDNPQLDPVPYARAIGCNNEFVFLLSADEKMSRVYQSGTRQPECWQVGQQSCAYNDFDVGGEVMAVSQGTSPLFFLRRGIWQARRADITGAFSWVKMQQEVGQFYYNSSAILNNVTYFLDQQGFWAADDGGNLTPIGFNKVNNWIQDVLTVHIPKCHISAFADSRNKRIYWNFCPDKTPLPPQPDYPEGEPYAPFSLVYDVLRDQWSRLTHAGKCAALFPWKAISLSDLTAAMTDSDLSFDSTVYEADGFVPAFLSGDGLTVTLQAAAENERAFLQAAWQGETDQHMNNINKFQPLIENPAFDALGQLECDLTAGHDPFYTPWLHQSRFDGSFLCRVRARTAKARILLPLGADWNKAQGIDMDVMPAGHR